MEKIMIFPENRQKIKCVNADILADSGLKPDLKIDEVYELQYSCFCGCGQAHYDIGLPSKLNYVNCYKCGRLLPKSDKIHWANSTRFIFV